MGVYSRTITNRGICTTRGSDSVSRGGGTVEGFRKQRQRGTSILHGYPNRSRGTGEREKVANLREREKQRERAKPFVLSFGHPV